MGPLLPSTAFHSVVAGAGNASSAVCFCFYERIFKNIYAEFFRHGVKMRRGSQESILGHSSF